MAKKRKTRSGPKEWTPRREVQEFAQKFAEEAAKMPEYFMYSGDLPIGKTWGYVFGRSRDSSLLEESNYETIKADLEERFPDDVEEERHSHWLVGWVDQLAMRLLDDDGVATRAAEGAYEWKEKLDDYPAADEEDWSRRESEATIENIKFEGGLDESLAEEVYSWLGNNEPEAIEASDGGGGYPSKEKIEEVLWALGKATEEMVEERGEAERQAKEEALLEEERMPPEEREAKRRAEFVDPPGQMRLFGRRRTRKDWSPRPDLSAAGTCVRLKRDVERFPHFIARAGTTGQIVEMSESLIAVSMDEPLEGAEEWENEIHWYPDDPLSFPDFEGDVQVLRRCP
jgi:hypothetical protein